MGRPSSFTQEVAQVICDRIAVGDSVRTICEDEGMPNRVTVLRWLETHPDFAAKYARAREAQADVMDEKIMTVADACTAETAAADRVKIGAYQWRAARLAPKRYGERVAQEISGPDGGPIETADITPTERARRIAFALQKGARKS